MVLVDQSAEILKKSTKGIEESLQRVTKKKFADKPEVDTFFFILLGKFGRIKAAIAVMHYRTCYYTCFKRKLFFQCAQESRLSLWFFFLV